MPGPPSNAESASKRRDLGTKSITLMGSIALTMNNISGPGMLEFPAIFQNAGWIPVAVTLSVVCVASSSCATLLADAMARIPGNDHFQDRHEFSDLACHFVGSSWFYTTQGAFYLCLLAQNVAGIVSTAQVLDSLLATFVLGKSYALEVYPRPFYPLTWSCADCSTESLDSGACVPFSYQAAEVEPTGMQDDDGDDDGASVASRGLMLTLGYVLCAALFVYPGTLNLEENIVFQYWSFATLIVLSAFFVVVFLSQSDFDSSRVPAVGADWSDCVGVVIFNFAYCVTIPSWVNEKRPEVGVNQVVWWSTVCSTILYGLVGCCGGMAFGAVPDNMLELLAGPSLPSGVRFAALVFGVMIIGLGIPIFCILMRYNLVVGGVCSPRVGFFAGGILPWLLAWMLYTGHLELELLSWAGLILNSFTGFALPAAVALAAARYALQQRWTRLDDNNEDGGAVDKETRQGGGEGRNAGTATKGKQYSFLPQQGLLAAKSIGGPQTSASSYGGVEIDGGGSSGSSSDRRHWTRETVPATIVSAFPDFLRPFHMALVQALCAVIAALVVTGLTVKIAATVAPG